MMPVLHGVVVGCWLFLLWNVPSMMQCAEHPPCGHPTWACGFRDNGAAPSSVRPASARPSVRRRHTHRAALQIYLQDVSLVSLSHYFPLIPHCCRFIAAQQRCTNNSASWLVGGWARDEPEPIRARQCVLFLNTGKYGNSSYRRVCTQSELLMGHKITFIYSENKMRTQNKDDNVVHLKN